LKTTYAAAAGGAGLGVRTEFHTPYANRLVLTGTKHAPDAAKPAEWLVTPDAGPVRINPTPSWVVALAPDYSWAAMGARHSDATPPPRVR
jgi:hypothetical protein